jgi:GNAT superfamily N-acetyltransferase
MDSAELLIERFDPVRHQALVEPLTELLHESYAPLARKGLRYYASHQPPEKTLGRLTGGVSFLAFWEGQLAGTISFYPSNDGNPCEYYRRPGLVHFAQYAVKTTLQGRGIAGQLLERMESYARETGAREIALDTAEEASELIAMYRRHGYVPVSATQWSVTNYRSVIMAKPLV